MVQNIGKQKWRREPAFDRQFREGRSHITCPKCNASLGDAWEEKGQRKYQFHRNFDRQFRDDRRHITCPKCSLLLAEVIGMPPTVWEWIKYICVYKEGKSCWHSLVFPLFVIVVINLAIAGLALHLNGKLGFTDWEKWLQGNAMLCVIVGMPSWLLVLVLGGRRRF